MNISVFHVAYSLKLLLIVSASHRKPKNELADSENHRENSVGKESPIITARNSRENVEKSSGKKLLDSGRINFGDISNENQARRPLRTGSSGRHNTTTNSRGESHLHVRKSTLKKSSSNHMEIKPTRHPHIKIPPSSETETTQHPQIPKTPNTTRSNHRNSSFRPTRSFRIIPNLKSTNLTQSTKTTNTVRNNHENSIAHPAPSTRRSNTLPNNHENSVAHGASSIRRSNTLPNNHENSVAHGASSIRRSNTLPNNHENSVAHGASSIRRSNTLLNNHENSVAHAAPSIRRSNTVPSGNRNELSHRTSAETIRRSKSAPTKNNNHERGASSVGAPTESESSSSSRHRRSSERSYGTHGSTQTIPLIVRAYDGPKPAQSISVEREVLDFDKKSKSINSSRDSDSQKSRHSEYSSHSHSHGSATWTNVYTALIVRHGKRDAEVIYTFTPPHQRSRWSRGPGELSVHGINGIRHLGAQLKRRYASLLGNLSKTDIRVFSTPIKRTAETARILVQEIYGVHHRQINILNHMRRWPTTDKERIRGTVANVDNEPFRSYERTLFDIVFQRTRRLLPNLSLLNFAIFVDTMLCEHSHGVILPKEILELMEYFHHYKYWSFAKQQASLYLLQAKSAAYISDIANSMKKIASGVRRSPKFEIFASHDSYIQNIMRALDTLPPFDGYFVTDFGCAIIFELYQSPNYSTKQHSIKDYIVKIRYSVDTSLNTIIPVAMYDCQHANLPDNLAREEPFCFLDEFYFAMKEFILERNEFLELNSGARIRNNSDYRRETAGYNVNGPYSNPILPI